MITTKLCTWHKSCVVLVCATKCSNLMDSNWIMGNFTSNLNCKLNIVSDIGRSTWCCSHCVWIQLRYQLQSPDAKTRKMSATMCFYSGSIKRLFVNPAMKSHMNDSTDKCYMGVVSQICHMSTISKLQVTLLRNSLELHDSMQTKCMEWNTSWLKNKRTKQYWTNEWKHNMWLWQH